MAKKNDTPAAMIDRGRYDYERVKFRDPSTGKIRHSAGNGDAVARAMLGLNVGQVVHTAMTAGLDELVSKHSDKRTSNPGQFRMIVGNALRALVRKGTSVQIGDHLVKKLDQKVALPPVDEPKKSARAA